jgi:MFS family permease
MAVQSRTWSGKLKPMVVKPQLLVASLANLLTRVVFGAIMSFFPLYAASLSLGEATIGSMFAIRALCSTLARLPTGLLTSRFSNQSLMGVALGLMMIVVFSISNTTTPALLGIFLAVEGIAYSMFLTSGQAFVTGRSTESDRGTVLGMYSAAGSLGSALAPFALGFIADLWGLAAVFGVTGVMVFIGAGVLGYTSLRQRRALTLESEAERHAV